MSQSASAVIIPFPRRQADLAASTERLADALTSLSTALLKQRDATQRWRDSLLALSASMQGGATLSA